MAVSRSTLESILKEVYLPPVVDQFNSKTLLLKLLRRNRRDFGGDGAYIPVMEARTHGHGARAENATLPLAQNNQYDNMFVNAKFNYAKIQLSGPSMAVARKDQYAFLRTLNAEISGVTEGFINDFNRQLFGNGGSQLSRTGVTAASATVVLDTTDKNAGWGTLYMEIGMLVDILVTASGATSTGVLGAEILDVDSAAGTITIDSSITTDDTFSVYVAGNRTAGTTFANSNEVMGLHGIINDQNPASLNGIVGFFLQGKDSETAAPAGDPWWRSSRLENGGILRDLKEGTLHDIFIACDRRSGLGHEISMLLSSHELWKEYGLQLTPDRRYAGTPDTYEGGFKYLTFDGVKWYFEKYCQPNRVYAPNLQHLTLFEESPVRWDETDGSLLKWRNDQDSFEAFLVYYSNLGVDRRQAHTVLEDLNQELLLP